MIYISLILLVLFAPEDWKLAKEKDGISVYTMKTEVSNLKDSKVIGQINSSVESIAQVLLDFDSYAEWIPSCIHSKTLKQISATEFYYYAEYKAPWPVANRDMVTHVKVSNLADGSIRIDLTGVAEYLPEENKKVRIPEFSGYWLLQPTGEDGVSVAINQFHTDPGGSIPAWLANTTAVDNPYKTFLKLRERLTK